jgi:uncharacterized protein
MKIFLTLLLASTIGFSQKTEHTFTSNALQTDRSITLKLPKSYDASSKRTYPLLLILDSEYLFEPFDGAISYGNYWDVLPEMIIVGINQSKTRFEDCGIDHQNSSPNLQGAYFFEFIGAELMPFIEDNYKISSLRMIAGHDITASFLNFFLYKDNPIFNAYISLNPELAPKMEINIAEKIEIMKSKLFYYQSDAFEDIDDIKEPVNLLNENIKLIQNPNLSYKYNHFTNSNHFSSVLYGIPNALLHIFKDYGPITNHEYSNTIATLEKDYTQYLLDKYEKIEKDLGSQIQMRLTDFKAIEGAILKNKDYNELDVLAQVADKYFPKTMLGNYELILMYEKKGDLKKARAKCKQAYDYLPIGDLTKDKIWEKYNEFTELLAKEKK